MRETVARREGDEIIIFILPEKGIGAGGIFAGAIAALAVQIPVEIAEGDLAVAGDGRRCRRSTL